MNKYKLKSEKLKKLHVNRTQNVNLTPSFFIFYTVLEPHRNIHNTGYFRVYLLQDISVRLILFLVKTLLSSFKLIFF